MCYSLSKRWFLHCPGHLLLFSWVHWEALSGYFSFPVITSHTLPTFLLYHTDMFQEDIDECLLGESVHQCSGDSQCVNKPGWSYCACRRGYSSYRNPLTQLTTCTDVDECEDGSHTCHHTATCLNTHGSYSCYCGADPDCSTACVLEGQTYKDGSSWQDGCNSCTCESGRVTCDQVQCDCSVAGADHGCCPECYDTKQCRHQELQGQWYSSGQRWSYRCMVCECMVS